MTGSIKGIDAIYNSVGDPAILGGSSNRILLKEMTVTAASEVDFVHGIAGVVFDDTYDLYVIEILNLVPSSDDLEFRIRLAVSGTFQTTNYNGSARSQAPASGDDDLNIVTGAYIPATADILNHGLRTVGNTYPQIFVTMPGDSNISTRVSGEGSLGFRYVRFFGNRDVEANDGIRFYPESGTISGTFRLWGIAKGPVGTLLEDGWTSVDRNGNDNNGAAGWDFGVDGSTAWNITFENLHNAKEIIVIVDSVTSSVASNRNVTLGVGNGPTYFTTSGNYKTIADDGTESNADTIGNHATGTTAARSVIVHIPNANIDGAQKINTLRPGGDSKIKFTASTAPITAVQIGQGSGNATGGKIWVLVKKTLQSAIAGQRILVGSGSVNGVSSLTLNSVNVTDAFSTPDADYTIEIRDLIVTTNDTFIEFEVSDDDGSTWKTTNYTATVHGTIGTTYDDNGTITGATRGFFPTGLAGFRLSSTSGHSARLTVRVSDLVNTSLYKIFELDGAAFDDGGGLGKYQGAFAWHGGTGALDALKINADAGNFSFRWRVWRT